MSSFAIPNLPGFRSNRQVAAAKSQNFTITRDGVPSERHPRAVESTVAADTVDLSDRFRTTAQLAQTGTREATLGRSTRRGGALASEASAPAFVELDRQVLRFYSYFKEAVHESAAEAARVRKCTIQMFLVDGHMMVIEHKEENSGIPQGTFVKRHLIPKPNGEAYTWRDLVVGSEITIYGRTLRIVDCDGFTRGFYEAQGVTQPEAEGYPEDSYATLRASTGPDRDGTGFGKKDNPLKKFMEASLGKVAKGRGEEEKLQQFLKNDRKVLRFFASWDDTGRLYGDKIAYILHYFLADDTVEVRESPVMNSGRDNFPMLLRKQRLPKDWRGNLHDNTSRGVEVNPPASNYVRARDLIVGGTVDVFGRTLQLLATDKFTTAWYQHNLGITQPSSVRGEASAAEGKAELPVPPYTGFGTDEDSLASYYHLVPKAPRKDFNKFMKNDRKVLRFSARLANACPEDRHRSFIIQLYMADDTLAIYEPAIRNSGIVGGQFLVRNKYKKANGEPYRGEDFVPGSEITIYKRRFLVVDADEYTKNTRPDLVPGGHDVVAAAKSGDAAAALAKVREALRRQGTHGIHALARRFRALDADGDAGLSVDDLAAGFDEAGAGLSGGEVEAVFTAFDADGNRRISFAEFVAAVRGQMNHRRLALCHAAYDLLDAAGDGFVKVDDMVAKYDFSQNERVLKGEQSVLEAAEEFVAQWDGLQRDGLVTREEFIDYCKGVSASIDSDDYFQLVMKKAWKI